jgi:nucleotide-binding universal stress UspA family protein
MSGIVVGIDGSHNSSRALEWAMTEAAIRNTDLTVITVHSVPAGYWSKEPISAPADEERVEAARLAAQEAVDATVAKLGSNRPKSVSVVAVNGFPVQTLLDAAKEQDLLVVGSRGSGGFAALVLGSVSNQVVHHAECPVVVVPAAK